MSRTASWQVVGRSSDPIPGDPVTIRSGARNYHSVAEAIANAAAAMRELDSGQSSGSESVEALLKNRDEIVDKVLVAQRRYRKAGTALETYATQLSNLQGEADSALSRAQSANNRAESDEVVSQRYWQQYHDALQEEDTDAADRFLRLARSFQEDAETERAQIRRLTSEIDRLVEERDVAAERAISDIETIVNNDGLNDGFWDNWGSKIVNFITQMAEVVAMVAGIAGLLLCWVPGLGAALLAIAAVAGVVAAVGNTVLAIAGEQSWGEALMSIGFALLGCVGLGGLRGILGAIRGGGRFLGQGGKTTLAAAFRTGRTTLAAGARTALTRLQRIRARIAAAGERNTANAARQTTRPGIVTYRRVQGGTGTQTSQQRITIDGDRIRISNHDRNLNVSAGNSDHAQYFLNRRPGGYIVEFDVPKWLDDMIQEYAIPQRNYRSNPANQGGMAPKITDRSTPGLSIELPYPWIEWLEEYATNGRVVTGGG